MAELSEWCRHLTILNVRGCRWLDDGSMALVVKSCVKLTELRMGQTLIGDELLSTLYLKP